MSTNRVIVSNTMFLYFRMILVIIVSFYTTRIVFKALGIDDFGLLNLINGFVILFTFLNSAMRSGTQRFLNTTLALNSKVKVNTVFCTSITIHALTAILVLLLTETLGLWFVNTKLNISNDKMEVANIIYQCSIFMVLINIISIPYQAVILAKEKMKQFAYIGIAETLMKLTEKHRVIWKRKRYNQVLQNFFCFSSSFKKRSYTFSAD